MSAGYGSELKKIGEFLEFLGNLRCEAELQRGRIEHLNRAMEEQFAELTEYRELVKKARVIIEEVNEGGADDFLTGLGVKVTSWINEANGYKPAIGVGDL